MLSVNDGKLRISVLGEETLELIWSTVDDPREVQGTVCHVVEEPIDARP